MTLLMFSSGPIPNRSRPILQTRRVLGYSILILQDSYLMTSAYRRWLSIRAWYTCQAGIVKYDFSAVLSDFRPALIFPFMLLNWSSQFSPSD